MSPAIGMKPCRAVLIWVRAAAPAGRTRPSVQWRSVLCLGRSHPDFFWLVDGRRSPCKELDPLFIEIVGVDLRNLDRASGDTDFVVDHQLSEPGAVDQHDAFDRLDELERLRRVSGCGDENSFLSFVRR